MKRGWTNTESRDRSQGGRVVAWALALLCAPLPGPARADSAACPTTGTLPVAVARVSFPSAALNPAVTAQNLRRLFSAQDQVSVSRFWNIVSTGKARITTEHFPRPAGATYKLDRDYVYSTDASFKVIAKAVVTVLASDQVAVEDYRFIVAVVPRLEGVYGVSQQGCETIRTARGTFHGSVVLINGADLAASSSAFAVQTLVHEMGHGLGLDHAATVELARPGERNPMRDDSGNMNSAMSAPYVISYDFLEKLKLGWVGAESITRVSTPGVYYLGSLDRAGPPGARLLRIPRGPDAWLSIEFRSSAKGGADDTAPAWLRPRALVYSEDARQRANSADVRTFLVEKAKLAPGKLWKDPYTSLSVEVLEQSEAGARVEVKF